MDGRRPKMWEASGRSTYMPSRERGKYPGASHISVPGELAPGTPAAEPATGKREQTSPERMAAVRPGSVLQPDRQGVGRTLRAAESTHRADRTDSLWAEMQAMLEEVELSASGGTHVFGAGHDRSLAELRTAQIALAQAWARSEADDAMEMALRDNSISATRDELGNKGVLGDGPRPGGGGESDSPKSNAAGMSSARPGGSGGGADRLGAKLGEETEVSILLARKRREANDQYFQRVNNGIVDVVAKLEDVAVAVRAVEQESKDMWNENASLSDQGL